MEYVIKFAKHAKQNLVNALHVLMKLKIEFLLILHANVKVAIFQMIPTFPDVNVKF